MWEISSFSQYLCFLYSVLMGSGIGVLYDVFKIDRMVFKRGVLFTVFQDILFWIISAFAFYSFSVVFSNGQVRGYLLFGCFMGFVIYRLTISRFIMFLALPVKKASFLVRKFYLILLNKINLFISFAFEKLKNFFKIQAVKK